MPELLFRGPNASLSLSPMNHNGIMTFTIFNEESDATNVWETIDFDIESLSQMMTWIDSFISKYNQNQKSIKAEAPQ